MSMMTDWLRHTCPRLEEQYYEATHKSGLRVLLCPKDYRTHHATLSVRYGSMDRFANAALPMGIAHFLEHKMFERNAALYGGSDSFDDDFAALGAEVNAYTSYDRTVYYVSCTEGAAEALTCLLRMVTEFFVTSDSVARERGIIGEEIRMNADDPWERLYAEARTALFGRHPMQEEICGTESSIRRITPTLLAKAFRRFYRPDRMVLTLCGGFSMEEVERILDAVLPATPPPEEDIPLQVSHRFRIASEVFTPRVVVHRQTAKPLFSISIKDPAVPVHELDILRRDLTMTILCEMLFSRSGDFYSHLFESGLVSPGMSYGSSVGRSALLPTMGGYGYFDLSGECHSPEAVLDEFYAFIRQTREKGLDPQAFWRAKRILYADFVASFDSSEDIASLLGSYAFDGLCAYDFFALAEGIRPADVHELFESAFRESQVSLSVVLPIPCDEP